MGLLAAMARLEAVGRQTLNAPGGEDQVQLVAQEAVAGDVPAVIGDTAFSPIADFFNLNLPRKV